MPTKIVEVVVTGVVGPKPFPVRIILVVLIIGLLCGVYVVGARNVNGYQNNTLIPAIQTDRKWDCQGVSVRLYGNTIYVNNDNYVPGGWVEVDGKKLNLDFYGSPPPYGVVVPNWVPSEVESVYVVSTSGTTLGGICQAQN